MEMETHLFWQPIIQSDFSLSIYILMEVALLRLLAHPSSSCVTVDR